jgi:hypothetical protein
MLISWRTEVAMAWVCLAPTTPARDDPGAGRRARVHPWRSWLGNTVWTGEIELSGMIDLNAAAGTGNDTVYARGGDDRIDGADGHDRLYGQTGNNRITGGAGNDQLRGGSGDDRLLARSGDDLAVGGRVATCSTDAPGTTACTAAPTTTACSADRELKYRRKLVHSLSVKPLTSS